MSQFSSEYARVSPSAITSTRKCCEFTPLAHPGRRSASRQPSAREPHSDAFHGLPKNHLQCVSVNAADLTCFPSFLGRILRAARFGNCRRQLSGCLVCVTFNRELLDLS